MERNEAILIKSYSIEGGLSIKNHPNDLRNQYNNQRQKKKLNFITNHKWLFLIICSILIIISIIIAGQDFFGYNVENLELLSDLLSRNNFGDDTTDSERIAKLWENFQEWWNSLSN